MAILYFLICLVATTIGAASGVGGGIIIKPIMDAVSGFPISTINFLSGCTVLIMSIISLISSRKDGVIVDKRRGTFLAIGAAVGGLAGKSLFDFIKYISSGDKIIGRVQSSTLIILTIAVIVYMINKDRIRTFFVKHTIVCILLGLVLGLIGSLLGIGGGPINLMLLHYFFSMDSKTAALNSLYIILFSQLAGVTNTIIKYIPSFSIAVLVFMAIGGVTGALIGRHLNRKLRTKQLDLMFLVLMITIIFINIYNFFKL